MELSGMQRMAKRLSSDEKFERMKEDSKKWRFTCTCGQESSIWDIGGIRYKAKGKPRLGLRCPQCNKWAMQSIYKVE